MEPLDHPSEETLKRFAAGKASREESRTLVAHLLKGCALCAARLKSLMEPPCVAVVSYDTALDRFDQGMVEALEASVSPMPAEPVSPPPRPPCAPPRGRRDSSG
jgi:hypothetical protein